jgi:Phosphoesterase family
LDSFPKNNDAETIFERLDAAGLSWRVYVDPGMSFSITGMIHTPRLRERFATHFSTHDDFFDDCENGKLPTYSFIEPNLLHAHNDYHPAYNALFPGLSADPPSSILGGEELLARIYSAIRASSKEDGSNYANTLFLDRNRSAGSRLRARQASPDLAGTVQSLGPSGTLAEPWLPSWCFEQHQAVSRIAVMWAVWSLPDQGS